MIVTDVFPQRLMQLCPGPRMMIVHRVLCVTGFAVLAGCAVNPSTGRNQLIALPAAQIAQADMGFALAAAAQGLASSSRCAGTNRSEPVARANVSPCPSAESIAKFARQVERIGAELATEAHGLAPELFTRISALHIGVETDIGAGSASSAGGRIILDSNLAALDPTDDVVAFLIAREMGHVIARHDEEDAGARMAFSALTALVPVGGLIVKFVASMLGSQALKTTWAERQRREADELALALLDRCHRSPGIIALNLRAGLKRERLPEGEWGADFAQSIKRVNTVALARPEGLQVAVAKYSAPGGRHMLLAAVQKQLY
jgi:Zn-dependent protease with chaperone function